MSDTSFSSGMTGEAGGSSSFGSEAASQDSDLLAVPAARRFTLSSSLSSSSPRSCGSRAGSTWDQQQQQPLLSSPRPAPLARLDSSSESVASSSSDAASIVAKGATATATTTSGEISATASIDSGVVMSSPLVWPTAGRVVAAAVGGDRDDDKLSQQSQQQQMTLLPHKSSTVVVLRADENEYGAATAAAAVSSEGGAAGPLSPCLADDSAATKAALASLNENLSCLSAVTHIPDANCTVQVFTASQVLRLSDTLYCIKLPTNTSPVNPSQRENIRRLSKAILSERLAETQRENTETEPFLEEEPTPPHQAQVESQRTSVDITHSSAPTAQTSRASSLVEPALYHAHHRRPRLSLRKSLSISKFFAGVHPHARSEWKATLTVGIVLFTFTFCWLPFFVLALYTPLTSDNQVPEWVYSLVQWLGYANSMLNPIIYGVLHRDFRKTFAQILSCRWRPENMF